MRAALAARDIGEVYRLLTDAGGVSQRQIAGMTGQGQSEVSEIMHGRPVRSVLVLERIADGLGVPRAWVRLAGDDRGMGARDASTYAGDVTATDPLEGVTDEMLRRHLLATAATSVLGQAVLGIGTLLDPYPHPGPPALPSRLGISDLTRLRALTERLRSLDRTYGGYAATLSTTAEWHLGLLSAPHDDAVTSSLGSALAELHNVAGWACYDSGLHRHADHHFNRAVELAGQVADGYRVADALRHAACMTTLRGHPNDALKLLQLAQHRLAGVRDEPRAPALAGWLRAESARALAHLGYSDMARSELAAARDGWEPPDAFERADMDLATALVEFDLGRLDVAESFAASSVRTWETGSDRRDGIIADITLARLYVTAREPRGIPLSRKAIDGVAKFGSARSRDRLAPLVIALGARRDAPSRELADYGRRVAAIH